MKTLILALFVGFMALQPATAQTGSQADPKDVGSLDAIIKAVYDVISGDAGKPRDWDRFRTLFHKDARLIPTSKNPTTKIAGANAVTPEDYIKRAEPGFIKNGFHERELARESIHSAISPRFFRPITHFANRMTKSRFCEASIASSC